jgi:hypothetical protein
MRRILRLTNVVRLWSPEPCDTTRHLTDATHLYLYFAEYVVGEDGLWEEDRSWVSTVSVEELLNVLDEAERLKEITSPRQSGGR